MALCHLAQERFGKADVRTWKARNAVLLVKQGKVDPIHATRETPEYDTFHATRDTPEYDTIHATRDTPEYDTFHTTKEYDDESRHPDNLLAKQGNSESKHPKNYTQNNEDASRLSDGGVVPSQHFSRFLPDWDDPDIDISTIDIAIRGYGKANNSKMGHRWFTRGLEQRPDIRLFNSMIYAYAKTNLRAVESVLSMIQQHQFEPNEYTYKSAMVAYERAQRRNERERNIMFDAKEMAMSHQPKLKRASFLHEKAK
ncbi:MAG: hypothetical protein SGCHY_005522 [Lobulomycetales sp.]